MHAIENSGSVQNGCKVMHISIFYHEVKYSTCE